MNLILTSNQTERWETRWKEQELLERKNRGTKLDGDLRGGGREGQLGMRKKTRGWQGCLWKKQTKDSVTIEPNLSGNEAVFANNTSSAGLRHYCVFLEAVPSPVTARI